MLFIGRYSGAVVPSSKICGFLRKSEDQSLRRRNRERLWKTLLPQIALL